MQNNRAILIGNAFPLSLVRSPVRIVPATVAELQSAAAGKRVVSFWGHANTLTPAEKFCGLPLMPAAERPVLRLNAAALPTLNGWVFAECWILSPEYAESFRPGVGQEVPEDQITDWRILKITWE
jgi:hypothetical protein